MSPISGHLTRRDFIKESMAGALGLSMGRNGWWTIKSSPLSAEGSRVVVGKSEYVLDTVHKVNQAELKNILDAVITRFTGSSSVEAAWKSLFSKKDVVGIKMNVMMNATHNELVLEIVRNLKSIGIPDEKIIIWDRDQAGIGEEGVYKRSKRFGFHRNSLSNIIMEHTTALINVPGVKTHWLSGIAVAVKNWCGAVTNINTRDENAAFVIHKNSCEDVGLIAAHPEIQKQSRLVVVDALRPLYDGGPQVNPRYLLQNKEIMVSADPVAVDALCLQKIQEKRFAVKGRKWPLSPPPLSIAAAEFKYNLGRSDLRKIDTETVTI